MPAGADWRTETTAVVLDVPPAGKAGGEPRVLVAPGLGPQAEPEWSLPVWEIEGKRHHDTEAHDLVLELRGRLDVDAVLLRQLPPVEDEARRVTSTTLVFERRGSRPAEAPRSEGGADAQ